MAKPRAPFGGWFPTPADLPEHSHAVAYDLGMVCRIAERFQHGTWAGVIDKDTVLNNAVVESFALRLRSLIHFLFGHIDAKRVAKPREGDILAIDFFPDWDKTCTSAPNVFLDAKERADKLIAHLTEERATANLSLASVKNDWDFADLYQKLRDMFQQFYSGADRTKFHPDARAKIAGYLNPNPNPNPSPPAAVGAGAGIPPYTGITSRTDSELDKQVWQPGLRNHQVTTES